MRHRACRHSVRFSLAVLAAATLSACARVPTQSASMAAAPGVSVTANQLQLQAFEMGRTLSMIIEQAADSIRAASDDPVVQRNALLLKITGIPLIQEAALRNDPQVAAVDLRAFSIQLSDYLTTGSGRTSFGDEQPIAVAAAAQAVGASTALIAGSLQGGQADQAGDARLRQWAASHPMQGPDLRRASILDSDWEALGFSENSLHATVGNVDRTLVNISYRLSYLNETLAMQARWNAELAGAAALRNPRVDSLLGTTSSGLHAVTALADTLPGVIDTQREALMRDLDLLRVALTRDIDRQRILAFQDLAAQVDELQAALTAERTAAMASADSLVQRSIDHVGVVAQRLALKLTLGALVVVGALWIGGMLLVHRWRATAA